MKTILKNLLSLILFLFDIECCDKDKDKVIRPPEEEHILDLAYSKDYTYPAGFSHEVIVSGSIYYENTVSIKPINLRQDNCIELNTTWSKSDLLKSLYLGQTYLSQRNSGYGFNLSEFYIIKKKE